MKQLFIGLIAEGTTDVRFLKNIIYKSILELSWSCDNQVDIFDIQEVTAEGDSFVNKMLEASKKACQTYGRFYENSCGLVTDPTPSPSP